MLARIKRNAPLLQALYHATPKKRKDILIHSSPDFIQTLQDCFKSFEGGHSPISFTIQKTEKAEKNYQTAGGYENQFKTQTSGSKEVVEGFCFTSLTPSVKSTDTTRVIYQRNSGGWFVRQNESYIKQTGVEFLWKN